METLFGCFWQLFINLRSNPNPDKPENILLDKSFANIWNDYTVYRRGGGKSTTALLHQIKNGEKI
jgi:hypothetical protein